MICSARQWFEVNLSNIWSIFRWDHWILDVIICNGGGTILGVYTLRWLSMKTYYWRGLYEIPTYRGKIKRFFGQFSPHGWIEFTWNPLSSFGRWIAIVCIIIGLLITELNTFYLKFVLWVPPNHILNPVRLLFLLLWGAVCKNKSMRLYFLTWLSARFKRNIPAPWWPWLWQTWKTVLGARSHCCHWASHLYQVWLVHHHQESSTSHCSVVGAGGCSPSYLHSD